MKTSTHELRWTWTRLSKGKYSFKLMFEDRTISIMAYNLETVLAEKFETVVTRSMTNTRMRDFYDIYILTTTQQFNSDTFKAALQKTVEKRGTSEQMGDMTDAIQTVTNSPIMLDLWQRYQKKYGYAANVTWEMAVRAVKQLAENATGIAYCSCGFYFCVFCRDLYSFSGLRHSLPSSGFVVPYTPSML